jgi:hypothetical protein
MFAKNKKMILRVVMAAGFMFVGGLECEASTNILTVEQLATFPLREINCYMFGALDSESNVCFPRGKTIVDLGKELSAETIRICFPKENASHCIRRAARRLWPCR